MYYEKRKNNSFAIAVILAFLIAIIFILLNLVEKIENNFLGVEEKVELTGTDTVLEEFNLQDLVNNASYSIVGISKLNEKNTSVFVENSEEKLGIGSGVILTSNGYILSNYETTGKEGENCFVTLKSGTIYPAEVKWADANLDISIIKIAAENLLILPMGDSNKVEIGEKMYILSNATGYDFSESLNEVFISKVNNTFKIVNENDSMYIEDVIKTNTNMESYKNGGALINENGEVLGIASSKINSIIPINRIKNILEKLKEDENYKEPYLGVHGFDNSVLKYLIPDYALKLGIYVDKVEENSPASGQILVGDVITKIDDYELSSFQELNEYLYLKSPREKITLSIIRGTKEMTIIIILNEKPRLL